MFRQVKNTSNLLDFVATRHCQSNPRPSSISRIRLTCTAALKVLLSLRLKTETTYLYSAFKVQQLASSAEALQLATSLNSIELIRLLYNSSKLYNVKLSSHKPIYFVNIIGGSAFPRTAKSMTIVVDCSRDSHAENT